MLRLPNFEGKTNTVDGKRRLLAIAFLVFLTTSFLSSVSKFTVEATETPSELTDADNALKQAFAAVLEAEQAGANVTVLLGRLNEGANLLAQAEMAYRVGDVSEAVDKAAGVFVIASEVEMDTVRASGLASISGQIAVWMTVGISIVAGSYFVFFMFWIWTWFKQNYIKNQLNSRLEVKSN